MTSGTVLRREAEAIHYWTVPILRTNRLVALPLALCYIAYPLSGIAARCVSSEMFRSWIDIAWAVLALVCVVIFPHDRFRLFWKPVWLILLVCFARVGLQILGANETIQMVPLLMELKPFLYLIFVFLWINRFGIPTLGDFVRFGTCLSAIIACEFVIASIAARTLVRPEVSGEVNYDAFLLILSFAVALNGGAKWRKHLVIIGAGLLLSFSRTAQAAALILALIGGELGLVSRIAVALGAAVGVASSFLVRDLDTSVAGADRFHMWFAAIGMFENNPWGFLFGYKLGIPLDVSVPLELQSLWHAQSHEWSETGVFAYNFHAMWIRLTISWGILTVLALLTLLVIWATRKRSALMRCTLIIILVEGLTMGVFYLSNVSIPLLFFMYVAEKAAGQQFTDERV